MMLKMGCFCGCHGNKLQVTVLNTCFYCCSLNAQIVISISILHGDSMHVIHKVILNMHFFTAINNVTMTMRILHSKYMIYIL